MASGKAIISAHHLRLIRPSIILSCPPHLICCNVSHPFSSSAALNFPTCQALFLFGVSAHAILLPGPLPSPVYLSLSLFSLFVGLIGKNQKGFSYLDDRARSWTWRQPCQSESRQAVAVHPEWAFLVAWVLPSCASNWKDIHRTCTHAFGFYSSLENMSPILLLLFSH